MKNIYRIISMFEFRNKFLQINWKERYKLRQRATNCVAINIIRDAIIIQLEDWNL